MIELQSDGALFVRPLLAVATAILALFVGKAMGGRWRPLRDYNVPEPVTGGLLFAAALWLLQVTVGTRVTFDLSARDVLLVYFFTTIGINARLGDLKSGGLPLVVLAACVAALVVLQNWAGVAVASVLGLTPAFGVLAGSVSLAGGHGTAVAWAPVFASERGIDNALEVGVLCATAGLIFASVAGGPLASFLVGRFHLDGPRGDVADVGVHYGEPEPAIDYFSFLGAVLAIHLSAAAGILVHAQLARLGLTMPLFMPCMIAGLLLTTLLQRVAPGVRWPSRTPALALIAELSLGIFLAMSLISMQLWTLASLAGPLLVLLAFQLVFAVLFAALVVFRALGRTYDAAVIATGFLGFIIGAVPTAMANMTAVTQRHGPSHVAFVIVPLVGAFFVTLLNTIVIRAFM